MRLDPAGYPSFDEDEIVDELYKNPALPLDELVFNDAENVDRFNNAVRSLYLEDTPKIKHDNTLINATSIRDKENQGKWFMPDQYQHYDIEKWLWLQCKNDTERRRVVEELEQYAARDLYPLLRYMKYLVDTMRKHKIVWGVGRGSSVASYVLYKIGIHKIDSLKHNLDWREFLR
jgi:DNA polymerase-3 subunit alpha